jgi:hypothetical protein
VILRGLASVSTVLRGLSALVAVLVAVLALVACGGDDDGGDFPDSDGGLTASELAAKLPDAGTPQAVAADVVAAKEAAGLAADADPVALGSTPEEDRFGFSTFFGLRELSALVENPVRSALDHSLITAYASHPFISDEAVALLSTSQDFEEIATSLEDAGWEQDGDVFSTDGDPEELTYTAAAPADGFVVLGYSPEGVEAVASGEAEPSGTGELEALEELDAPVTLGLIPEGEGTECISSVAYEDFVDGTTDLFITVDGKADTARLAKDLPKTAGSIGFEVISTEAEGDTLTVELEGLEAEGVANSPALLVVFALDQTGPLLDDCG